MRSFEAIFAGNSNKGGRENRADIAPKITKQHLSGPNQWEARKYRDIPRNVQ